MKVIAGDMKIHDHEIHMLLVSDAQISVDIFSKLVSTVLRRIVVLERYNQFVALWGVHFGFWSHLGWEKRHSI